MVRKIAAFLALIVSLASCATPPETPPPGWPAYLRYDLVPRWIAADGTVHWPPGEGCVAPPVKQTIPPGTLIDRFGRDSGSFFSPRGESFAARAVPYVCRQMEYRVYKVDLPLPVETCKAAAWFGSPGGALQFDTAASAADLLKAGTLELVSDALPGAPGPAPQCDAP
jgi:hypothetical protein